MSASPVPKTAQLIINDTLALLGLPAALPWLLHSASAETKY